MTKYQNAFGIDNKLKVSINGTAKYFLTDHLGSTNGLADASGNLTEQTSYDSFGNATSNLSTRYQFTGREFDNFTGLHYYRARWYDGNLGRFISEDPIGLTGGINQFAYSENNSLNRTDPSGLLSDGREEAIAAVATVATRIVTIPGVGQIILYGTVGLGVGYAIGYYPGQWSARYFYPEQFPDTQTQPETCPTTKPKPQPIPTPTPNDSDILYRGVADRSAPGLLSRGNNQAYNEALLGIARPIGGDSTPEEHNEGNTNSIYTSWTDDYGAAKHYATNLGNGGVILTATIPKSRQVRSFDRYESEILVIGVVTGAKVRMVK